MKTAHRLAFGFATAIAIAAFHPAASHADVQINDSAVDLTLDCNKDPVIQMNGASSTLVITGPCTMVALNGATNTVTIESSLKIAISAPGAISADPSS